MTLITMTRYREMALALASVLLLGNCTGLRGAEKGAALALTSVVAVLCLDRLHARLLCAKQDGSFEELPAPPHGFLRSSGNRSTELAEEFLRIHDETIDSRQSGERPNFRVFIEGKRKPLRPAISDEVYSIGLEALMNAFRHSHARNIEIEMQYGSRSLRIVVRDDGCGIEPQLLAGRNGRRGLSCMRERAERIGGRLRLWSGPGFGTELELSVPAHLAF